jgi:hypothetical protein
MQKKLTVREYIEYLKIQGMRESVVLPDYILDSSLLSNDDMSKKQIKEIRQTIKNK